MEKNIRFITPDYKDMFMVKDGGSIRIGQKEVIVQYVDEYHFKANGHCWHIGEFAEKTRRDVMVPLTGFVNTNKLEEISLNQEYIVAYIPDIKEVVLFANHRVCNDIPGCYRFELRHSDEGTEACEIKEHIVVNFYGTIISKKELIKNGQPIYLEQGIDFLSEHAMMLQDFLDSGSLDSLVEKED